MATEGVRVVRLLREVDFNKDRLPVNAVIETTDAIADRLIGEDAAEELDPETTNERYPINPILLIGKIHDPLPIDPDRM